MQYKISKAVHKDVSLMQRLFFQTITFYGANMLSKDELKKHSRFTIHKEYSKNRIDTNFVYNAKLNGEVIGSILLTKNGNIDYVFVHYSYKGKGVARSLFDSIEQVAKEHQIKMLTTEVNAHTESFFKKFGFDIIKTVDKVVGGEELITYSAVKCI